MIYANVAYSCCFSGCQIHLHVCYFHSEEVEERKKGREVKSLFMFVYFLLKVSFSFPRQEKSLIFLILFSLSLLFLKISKIGEVKSQ